VTDTYRENMACSESEEIKRESDKFPREMHCIASVRQSNLHQADDLMRITTSERHDHLWQLPNMGKIG
jgi:hypothetical protein